MALESKLQTKIIRYLKRDGWLVNKIMLCSISGWPDVMALKKGRMINIEVKSKGKKARPLQNYVHEQIRLYGGEVYVVDRWEAFLGLMINFAKGY